MKNTIAAFIFCGLLVMGQALAVQAMDAKGGSHSSHGAAPAAPADHADHSAMSHGSSHDGGTFKHAVMVDDIHAEFQVMDLASMNMKDPDGKTHHVMVSFAKNDEKITKAVGKVKLIAPSGKEQLGDLEDFGSGVFATNFTIDEMGKWGVICLFKDEDGKHTVKFWYNHDKM